MPPELTLQQDCLIGAGRNYLKIWACGGNTPYNEFFNLLLYILLPIVIAVSSVVFFRRLKKKK
ncbi:hypothetical protein A3D85_00465 [Candidatus Amesbacteria bacterium RIFCSPHIGHO2_02_FULL_47_9]|uniref:Uncharacterized protein n=1 Tax=Candidatus Amesbacteria bacterium RIFCSPHIGHO2_01_FULL_48_32b TaxID=1797253 RepID=A0A1F4YDK0_9BACT|nr:MAG: hypothetical protein A2876_01660 [Candidatus Amesbacteria bacterium RIFCSPHIGHO2_01_FULL_48_32b]OGD04897.1 MAG: hypothetical protein A3D85_00465 [Candidatus Amesbacteria bacterium RIFCSPHIGHO2_02_FULL_47_9]OGD07073.1 MAG: hypothetical protein A2899_00375 [Candidatus Amesbacteria bacterium RIFCSPLOWO2_01_FULL_49_25]